MLYLNNPLLTSEKIISYLEENLKSLSEALPSGSKKPTQLNQLKNKLKANFFEHLDKTASDKDVLAALSTDDRFLSNYLKLKQILSIIFSLSNVDDKTISRLKNMKGSDWDMATVDAQFDKLNTNHGYFDTASKSHLAYFTELAIACRTMIVLFEKNNTADDLMAYDYAYKLMALFVDPSNPNTTTFDNIAKETYDLVLKNEGDKLHPFHDALLVKLDLPNAHNFKDKAGWRELVKKEGVKAFYFLAMAGKIEEKIAINNESAPRAPKNLNEAKNMAMLCKYARADEDPMFAELCHQYKVNEDRFNSCLDYMASGWPKKTSDSLPDVQIKGEGDAEGFYWLKLPISDKRALILGDITNCCQSIDGHSDQCVKDAVSLSDNGLYVLLKQRKKGNPVLIINGEINDKDFKVTGQAYTWKSKMGNVCLDSIECLKDEIPNAALKKIISDFAAKLLQDNSGIKYVTVGRGGKTPEGLFSETLTPEKIRQGYAYDDSSTQYCIAKAPSALTETQQTTLQVLLEPYSQSFKECIDYLCGYLIDSGYLVDQLETLLKSNPSFATDLTPGTLSRLLMFNQSPTISDFDPVDFCALEQLSPKKRKSALKHISTARLLWKATSPKDLVRAFPYVHKNERLKIMLMDFEANHKYSTCPVWLGCFKYLDKPRFIKILNLLSNEEQLELSKARDERGNDLLYHAVTNNHCSVVTILLENGANVDAADGAGDTALMTASGEGRLDIAKLLLDKDADVNAVNKLGKTALILASNQGYLGIVSLLLGMKANVNTIDEYGDTALMHAVRHARVDVIKLLLTKNVDVNVKNKNGYTALLDAASGGHWNIVKCLLEHNADVNIKGDSGRTALIYASRKGQLYSTRLLLDKDADVNAVDDSGETSLMYASREGHLAIIRLLLAKKVDVNVKDKNGITALLYACMADHWDIAKVLLENDADVNIKGYYGKTVLMLASKKGHVSFTKLLLDKDADVNAIDEDGETPLMFASMEGHLGIIRLLLNKKADVNVKNKRGDTAFFLADRADHGVIVKALLESEIDVNLKSFCGKTSLMCVSRNGDMGSVKLLLNKQADVNSVDESGDTALMYASREGHRDITKLLLAHKANVDVVNKRGYTALILSSKKGHIGIIKLLLAQNANMNVKSNSGNTALFHAISAKHWDIATYLLENGADVNIQCEDGKTVLMCASAEGLLSLTALMLDKDADTNVKTDDGINALLCASYRGHLSIVKLLLDKGADVDAKDKNGKTAIMHALWNGHLTIANLLLYKSIEQNSAAGYGLVFMLLMIGIKMTLDEASKGTWVVNSSLLLASLSVMASIVGKACGIKLSTALSRVSIFAVAYKQKNHESLDGDETNALRNG